MPGNYKLWHANALWVYKARIKLSMTFTAMIHEKAVILPKFLLHDYQLGLDLILAPTFT